MQSQACRLLSQLEAIRTRLLYSCQNSPETIFIFHNTSPLTLVGAKIIQITSPPTSRSS